jgi:hypothetical protein
MDALTVSSSMLIPSTSNVEMSPAMLAVLWSIAHELDRRRIPANMPEGVWLEVPSARLRNPDGRTDNFWLRQCLDRLTGVKLNGEYRGDPWGAVILAEWEIKEGGSIVRLFLPPASIAAIRSPDTFARIEVTAAYRLKSHARRLYAALADKKRQSKKTWHEYTMQELRIVINAEDKYPRWADFRRYVLLPAVQEINDFGTVNLDFNPIKSGRSFIGVRFDWRWKNLDEAKETDEENGRHGSARHKAKGDGSAPPLTDEAMARWEAMTEQERAAQIERARSLEATHGFWPQSVPRKAE